MTNEEARAAATRTVLDEISVERDRQHRKWAEQNHPDGTGPDTRPLWAAWPLNNLPWNYPAAALAEAAKEITGRHAENGDVTWSHILLEEVFEALAEDDPEKLRAELIQVAAVAAQWAEAIDRRLMDAVHASRSSRYVERAAELGAEAGS